MLSNGASPAPERGCRPDADHRQPWAARPETVVSVSIRLNRQADHGKIAENAAIGPSIYTFEQMLSRTAAISGEIAVGFERGFRGRVFEMPRSWARPLAFRRYDPPRGISSNALLARTSMAPEARMPPAMSSNGFASTALAAPGN